MTDPKKTAEAPPATPAAAPQVTPAQDPDELSDAELDSVAGGFAPTPALDNYSSTNFLEA